MLTPKQFEQKMKEIFQDNDPEREHAEADEIIAGLLAGLGYKKGIKIFDDATKWYA